MRCNYGFVKGRSTFTNRLHSINYWTSTTQSDAKTIDIYIDTATESIEDAQ